MKDRKFIFTQDKYTKDELEKQGFRLFKIFQSHGKENYFFFNDDKVRFNKDDKTKFLYTDKLFF